MGFRYTLRFADGDDAGGAEYPYMPIVGDEIIVSGNRQMRVTAVVPLQGIEEFVDRRALCGVLEVEPT